MINFLFKLVKNVIVSMLLIYSFDLFAIYFNFSIPINFITVFLVSFFDFFALFCIFLFSMIF